MYRSYLVNRTLFVVAVMLLVCLMAATAIGAVSAYRLNLGLVLQTKGLQAYLASNSQEPGIEESSYLEQSSTLLRRVASQGSPKFGHNYHYYHLGTTSMILDRPEDAARDFLSQLQFTPYDVRSISSLSAAHRDHCSADMNAGRSHSIDETDQLCAIFPLDVCASDADSVASAARREFDYSRYNASANLYYCISMSGGVLSPSQQFQYDLSRVVAWDYLPPPMADGIRAEEIHKSGPLEIDANTLRWVNADPFQNLDYGDTLSEFPGREPKIGTMWWAGRAAVVVYAPKNGEYELTIRAQHSSDQSGILQIEHNLEPTSTVVLDSMWRTHEMPIQLNAGLNVIGVKYVEDKGDAQIDSLQVRLLDSLEQSVP